MHTFIEAARLVAAEFEYTDEQIVIATNHFVEQLTKGLNEPGLRTFQIPSYVSAMPDGSETGRYLAADLGGTNFRISLVEFYGNSKYTIEQNKVEIPASLMVASSWRPLFAFMAEEIKNFLYLHDKILLDAEFRETTKRRPLAFTFSFTVEQISLGVGKLLAWDKGFSIPQAIGKDPCIMLQAELDHLNVPVRIVALANDTVGTLLAQQYTSEHRAVLGAVFGTGTNGAYLEKVESIRKIRHDFGTLPGNSPEYMAVNTEWGGLDDEGHQLIVTRFDEELDQASLNPGKQRYEKLISGMYLGELLRRAILHALKMSDILPLHAARPNAVLLERPWHVPTSILSALACDPSDASKKMLEAFFDRSITEDELTGIRVISNAIGTRAAKLAGVSVAAVVLKTGCLVEQTRPAASRLSKISTFLRENYCTLFFPQWKTQLPVARMRNSDIVSVGLDGSLADLYPGFIDGIKSTLVIVPGIGLEGTERLHIEIVKDGSSMGSALIARAAELQAALDSQISRL